MVGDRFVKDGKTYEKTSEASWGYGFKEVTEEVFEATEVFKATEVFEEAPIIPEEPVKKTRRRRIKDL